MRNGIGRVLPLALALLLLTGAAPPEDPAPPAPKEETAKPDSDTPAPKPDKAESKPEAEPQPKPEAVPEPKAEPAPEPKAEPEPTPEKAQPKPKAKPDAPKAKPDAPKAKPDDAPQVLPTGANATAPTTDKSDPWYPFGGSILLSNMVGTGTFLEGPAQRPYYNMLVALRPHVLLNEEFSILARAYVGFNINVVENADSLNTYAHQPQMEDVRLGVSLGPYQAAKFDTWPSSSSPASLSVTTWFDFVFPSSLQSQLATQLVGLRLGGMVSFNPFDWLEIGYSLGVTKNFNSYPNTVIDERDFDTPPRARAGDPAGIDTFLIATGNGATEWGVSNTAYLSFYFLERLTLYFGFSMTHAFTYLRDIPKDGLSSPYAEANRGQTDLMQGIIELSVVVHKHLSVALGTLTLQAPYAPDNTTLRSPFWDATNGSANRQVIYLDIIGRM